MLKFDPPELRDDLARAIERWKRKVHVDVDDYFTNEFVDVTKPGFDAAEHEDRTITPETEFGLSLPEWDNVAVISCHGFIELTEEMEHVQLIERHACWTDRRYLLRVAPANDQTYVDFNRLLPEPESAEEREAQIIYIERDRERRALGGRLKRLTDDGIYGGDPHFDEELFAAWHEVSKATLDLASKIYKSTRRYFTMPVTYNGIEATCYLTAGFTLFGSTVAASGDYDEFFPPIVEGELFVEVRFRGEKLSLDTSRYVADAYLFELSSSVGFEFEADPRPSLDYEDSEEPEWRTSNDIRLRPLLLGMGMPELLRLYNRAAVATDDEVRLLYFTKVMEYVSQTVVRQRANEAIRVKLLSPRSLSPDAAFITELQAIVEEQRTYRRDREAVKQAAIVCCEAGDLARAAVPEQAARYLVLRSVEDEGSGPVGAGRKPVRDAEQDRPSQGQLRTYR